MACKLEKTVICGHDYTCTQMAATESIKFKFKMANLFGSSIADLMAMKENSPDDINSEIALLVTKLLSNVDPDKFIPLMKQIIGDCAKNGQRINFEQEYSGNTAEAYAAFGFGLMVNYKDFFLEIRHILKDMLSKKAEDPKE